MKNSIENIVRDQFENFELEVNSKVWEKVKKEISHTSKTKSLKLLTNIMVAIVSSGITAIATVSVMNLADNKKKDNLLNKTEIKVVTQQNKFAKKEEKISINNINTTEKIERIALIKPSAISGNTPFEVDLSNTGKGTKNTWIIQGKKSKNNEQKYVFCSAGIYTIKLISVNNNGQSQTDSIKVKVKANNADTLTMTVNNSLSNTFNIKPVVEDILKVNVKIYNSNGELVYGWDGIEGKWEGQNYKGEPVQKGNYFYTITTTDLSNTSKITKGIIKLNR